MTDHPSPANNSGALFGMTDLEEMLAGPDRKLVVSSLVSRLTHLHERIDASVRSGLRPDEFKRAEALGKALNVARGLLASMPSD